MHLPRRTGYSGLHHGLGIRWWFLSGSLGGVNIWPAHLRGSTEAGLSSARDRNQSNSVSSYQGSRAVTSVSSAAPLASNRPACYDEEELGWESHPRKKDIRERPASAWASLPVPERIRARVLALTSWRQRASLWAQA